MAKDHFDSKNGKQLLSLHGLQLAARVLLYAPSQTGSYTPQHLLNQLCSTGWNKK